MGSIVWPVGKAGRLGILFWILVYLYYSPFSHRVVLDLCEAVCLSTMLGLLFQLRALGGLRAETVERRKLAFFDSLLDLSQTYDEQWSFHHIPPNIESAR